MDFDGAIQAHTNWKLRLFSACKGSSKEKFDVGTVQKDNVCELGKWLYADARKLVDSQTLQTLLQTHAAFHRSAAGLANLIDRGQSSTAEKMLTAPDSEFNKLSTQVVGQLAKLRNKHSQG